MTQYQLKASIRDILKTAIEEAFYNLSSAEMREFLMTPYTELCRSKS